MSALLGRTDRHDAPTAHPRISRLAEAVLTFLVAATAAFLVCAQANAALDILQMTVSEEELIESYTHTTTVKAKKFFEKVEWFVNDEDNPSETQEGTDLSSAEYKRTYDGFGGPRGKPVKITAKVTFQDGGTASKSITFNAWSSSSSIAILKKMSDARLAKDEVLDFSVKTDVGFWYVSWYVDGKHQKTENGPALESQFQWTFSSGSREGKIVKVEAVAYGINTNGPLPFDNDITMFTVFDDYGFVWRRMVSRVESFYNPIDHEYVFTSGHFIEYYYDGHPRDMTLRRKAYWYEDGEEHKENWPPEDEEPFFATPSFWGSAALPMDTTATLTAGKEYYVEAYTNYGGGNPPADVESDKAFYNPKAADPLPIPTGKEAESSNDDNIPDVLK